MKDDQTNPNSREESRTAVGKMVDFGSAMLTGTVHLWTGQWGKLKDDFSKIHEIETDIKNSGISVDTELKSEFREGDIKGALQAYGHIITDIVSEIRESATEINDVEIEGHGPVPNAMAPQQRDGVNTTKSMSK